MFAWMTRCHPDYTMSSHSSVAALPARQSERKDKPKTKRIFLWRFTQARCTPRRLKSHQGECKSCHCSRFCRLRGMITLLRIALLERRNAPYEAMDCLSNNHTVIRKPFVSHVLGTDIKKRNGSCQFTYIPLKRSKAVFPVQPHSVGFLSFFERAGSNKAIKHGNDLHLYCLRIIRVAIRNCDGGLACSATSGGRE